jgi:3-oxoacyl-[acyl-carrier-protein] synthase-3
MLTISPRTPLSRIVKISDASIAGVVSCLPDNRISNEHFIAQFGAQAVQDCTNMIGVEYRYWANNGTSTKDLCAKAGARLLAGLDWDPESVDAIIFLSQTDMFRLPASACVLQKELKLSRACIAFDINLGCSGYPYALWLGMSMVQTGAANRVLLAVGDTVSKIVDQRDRSTAMLFGDAATVTAIESSRLNEATFALGTDGSGANNLYCREGSHTLCMDGVEIFNFTLKTIPSLVNHSVSAAGRSIDQYDGFLLHQANMFMLKHLIKRCKLPASKTPLNIDQYGNTSSASIPLLMTTSFKDQLSNRCNRLAMFGFGVGYSWASASLNIGPLNVVETIYL